MSVDKKEALKYHENPSGKVFTGILKPVNNQHDLSLAYTPGVAEPCREIQQNPDKVYKYTTKGNLVAVVSDGTAVLGLGNIGPEAGLPVMEGKAVLFKKFGKVDAHHICLGTQDPDEIIKIVKALEPTYGGINLEDIKAPECFYIEEELKKAMKIPVFHDDQHGTAIISGAGLLNALEITNRDISKIKVVFSGGGAAGIASAKFYKYLGVKSENIVIVDSKGVIYKGRQERMNKYKEEFAVDTDARTLKEAVRDADVFVGVSKADCLTKEMLLSMADNPIVFAMANPNPEIKPEIALKTRKDIIMATGRSDYDNQVNNVLGFPFIFRGALDVRARDINEEMKIAAAESLAALAKEPITDEVRKAYNKDYKFGPNYIIPKPLDSRVLLWESAAVAEAAIKSGVAGVKDFDPEKYKKELQKKFGIKI